MNKITIAIVGSGPSGLYAADAILKNKPDAIVYIFDALFCPYGLVRSGVAPDHFKIKEVSKLFDKILSKEQVHFLGNVHIGKDITVEELKGYFSAVIFCTGAHKDRALGIEGENLTNVTNATNFVGWYNAHPWFQDFSIPFNKEKVYVIGQGNVAVDVTRILLKSAAELSSTDISPVVLEQLKNSQIKEVHMIGRRGPLEAAFTDKELKELGDLEDVHVNVRKEDLKLSDEEQAYLESAPKTLKSNFEILKNFSEKNYNHEKKTLFIRFFLSPIKFTGATDNSVKSISLVVNKLVGDPGSRKAIPTETVLDEQADIILKSIGYKGQQIEEGLPWNSDRGTFLHEVGWIDNGSSQMYTSGWIKRGPSGVIGTNKADSVETIQTLLNNLEKLPVPEKPSEDVYSVLEKRKVRVINYQDWKRIDQEEVRRAKGTAPRLKFYSNQEAIQFLDLKE